MTDTAVHRCMQCGAPLPVALGGVEVQCRGCGHRQLLDARVDRDLRAHYHSVNATLELADAERAKLDGSADGSPKPSPLAGLAVLLALGGLGATMYFGTVAKDGEKTLYALGCMVTGYVTMGLYEGLRRLVTNQRSEPPVRTLECRYCGGIVPFALTDHAVTCTYCKSEVLVTEKARKKAQAAADRELAFVRAQAEAQRMDREGR